MIHGVHMQALMIIESKKISDKSSGKSQQCTMKYLCYTIVGVPRLPNSSTNDIFSIAAEERELHNIGKSLIEPASALYQMTKRKTNILKGKPS